jgi:hypothetical protein
LSRSTVPRTRSRLSMQTGIVSIEYCRNLKIEATVFPEPCGPVMRSIGPLLLM